MFLHEGILKKKGGERLEIGKYIEPVNEPSQVVEVEPSWEEPLSVQILNEFLGMSNKQVFIPMKLFIDQEMKYPLRALGRAISSRELKVKYRKVRYKGQEGILLEK